LTDLVFSSEIVLTTASSILFTFLCIAKGFDIHPKGEAGDIDKKNLGISSKNTLLITTRSAISPSLKSVATFSESSGIGIGLNTLAECVFFGSLSSVIPYLLI